MIADPQVNGAVKAAAFYQHALGAKLLADTYFGESKDARDLGRSLGSRADADASDRCAA